MNFRIISSIDHVEVIAGGKRIRTLPRLRKLYGAGGWRKLKGTAVVEFTNGSRRTAELHWYEAHGIGKKEFKIKRLLD